MYTTVRRLTGSSRARTHRRTSACHQPAQPSPATPSRIIHTTVCRTQHLDRLLQPVWLSRLSQLIVQQQPADSCTIRWRTYSEPCLSNSYGAIHCRISSFVVRDGQVDGVRENDQDVMLLLCTTTAVVQSTKVYIVLFPLRPLSRQPQPVGVSPCVSLVHCRRSHSMDPRSTIALLRLTVRAMKHHCALL